MKSHGNLLMNKIYNPKNIKPPIPTDIDEADSCMERFIRQKYQYRSLEDGKPKPPSREDASYTKARDEPRGPLSPQRSAPGSPGSPTESPPPLPPKSGKFFGFGLRSSSSTSNLRRFGTKKASTSDQQPWSPPPPAKTTGLGAPVADVTTASLEAKMAVLHQLGFTNNRRNDMVLKGLNEDLERCIDTLARLGEGDPALIRARKAAMAKQAEPTRSVSAAVPMSVSKSESSNNPFDRAVSNPIPQQPQSAQPTQTPYNPFDQMTESPQTAQPLQASLSAQPLQTSLSAQPMESSYSSQPLETSFQGLQVSQPLFPHSTGGYPNRANSLPQPPYQQTLTPPVSRTFSQGAYVSSPQAMDSNYNPFFQTAPQPQAGIQNQSYPSPGAPQNNPFFNAAAQTQYSQPQPQQSVPALTIPQPPQHANTMPALSSTSPFGTSPFGTSPFGQTPAFPGQQQQQQPQQQQQQQQQQQPQQPQQVGQGSFNPFQQSMAPPTPQSAGGFPTGYPNQFQQPQQLVPQATGRMDKNSILGLYNLAPSPTNGIPPIPEQSQMQFQQSAGASPVPQLTNSINSTPQSQAGFSAQTPQQPNGNLPNASRNPWSGTTPNTGTGSGLAAQAGINPAQPSSGLGIGMGANGAAAPAPAQAFGMGATVGMKPNPSPFTSVNPALPRTHMSQPSVDINGLQGGRHSPDAFASLSSRYG